MEKGTAKLRKPVESGCRKQDRGDAIDGKPWKHTKEDGKTQRLYVMTRVNFEVFIADAKLLSTDVAVYREVKCKNRIGLLLSGHVESL